VVVRSSGEATVRPYGRGGVCGAPDGGFKGKEAWGIWGTSLNLSLHVENRKK